MQNNVNLSPEAISVINALQHKNGTFNYYRATINRLHTYILHQSDEIGMSDTETLHTLRVLDAIRADLAALAGSAAIVKPEPDTHDDITERVENMIVFEHVDFSDHGDSADDVPGDKLDEPREMLHDVNVAWQKINQLQVVISEAITHATNAGEKYDSVISDLNDANQDLELVAANLDAIMAINPDTYEPKKPTAAEKAATFLQRAAEAISYGEELFIDAVDYAKRAGAGDAFKKRALEIDRSLTNSIELVKKLIDYAPLLENHNNEPQTSEAE